MDVLNKFLQAEINSKEDYESIINFINLYEIRKGEFEGNEYVIMKMDRDNFIIFSEYDDGEGGIQIPFSLSIYKNSLLDAINRVNSNPRIPFVTQDSLFVNENPVL